MSIKHPHTNVTNANCLAHDIVTHQDRASIKRLVCAEPVPFWSHVVWAPWVK